MPSFESTIATIGTILAILSLIIGFRSKINKWYSNNFSARKESLKEVWERIVRLEWTVYDFYAESVEEKIEREIEKGASIKYILKLRDKYRNIPAQDGKKRNGHVDHIVDKYVEKRSCD